MEGRCIASGNNYSVSEGQFDVTLEFTDRCDGFALAMSMENGDLKCRLTVSQDVWDAIVEQAAQME